MTDSYEDIVYQLDGYTIQSTLLSSTSVSVHYTKSKSLKVFTTIHKDMPPSVEYEVSLNNGLECNMVSSLEVAIAMYLGE